MLALTSSRAFNISLLHSAFGINLGCAISLPIFTRRRMHDMKLVIAEKPSVAQSIACVIGATGRKDGYLEGPCRSSGPAFRADRSGAETGYLVSWCIGHLVELSAPETYDERYSKWRLEDLPILPESWRYQVSSGTKNSSGS